MRRISLSKPVLEPVNQVLKAEFSALGRFVKLLLFRQAGDATIKLGEVEIIGREARANDKVALAKPKEYYIGPAVPDGTGKDGNNPDWTYLTSGGFTVGIDKKRGSVGTIYNNIAKRRCVLLSCDTYHIETRKYTRDLSEAGNVVEKSLKKNETLVFTCRNKGMKDVKITQIYKITRDGLSKTTELVNEGAALDLFVTVGTTVVADEKFRKKAWYLGADRGLGGRIKASDVTMPMGATCHSPKNTKVVLLMNYAENFGVAQYRYGINGEYCNPVTSRYFEKANNPPIYTPNGWRMGLVTLHLKPGEKRSVETRWNLFANDEFFFFKQFSSIPEVAKLFNVPRPDWLLRLKTIVSDFHAFPFGKGDNKKIIKRWIHRSADLYDEGCLYMLVCGQDVWGDWYKGEKISLGWTGEKIDNRYLAGFLNEIRGEIPYLKLGLYTWAWTGWVYSKAYTKHPEWYIDRNKNGYLKKAYQNGPQNFLRRISAPGSMEDFLSSAKLLMRDFDPDFFYIDGGGGGCNSVDWQRLKLDYDTDWQKFHWELNRLTRSVPGRKRAFFTNARSGAFVDIGFIEGINNNLSSAQWRKSADALLAVKMRMTLFPKMTIIPIYWRTNTLPFYSNYCIGLGLVPENIYPSRELRNVAYVTAAYENRLLKFTPANIAPDWRKNEETELEAYAMTHAPAAFFSIINHSKIPTPQTVSADAAKLGLDSGKPIFSWLIRMRDSRNRTKTTGVSERTAKKVYGNSGWGVDLVAAPEFLGLAKATDGRIGLTGKFDLDVLNMALFTNSPAVVYSTNGRRCQIWQPAARGITVDGALDIANRHLTLNAVKNDAGDVATAEVLVYVPNEWGGFSVEGAELAREVFVGKQKFLLLRLNAFGEIRVAAEKSAAFEIKGKIKVVFANFAAPGRLDLNLPNGAKHVTIYKDGVPVFFGESNEIVLPKELESGKYAVRALVGDTLISGDLSISSSWKYDYPNIRPERKASFLNVTEVNRVVNGLRVLKKAENSFNGYHLPLFTRVNAETLKFAAGSSDYATSLYGYAMGGLEIDAAKVLSLRMENTFFRHWSNYERETRKAGNPNAFAGLIVDYHTSSGYSKRVALGMGLMQTKTKARQPLYGKKSKPDAFVRLNDYIHLSKSANLALDLRRWAPKNWDGRVWISAAVNGGVFAGRKLFFTITGNGDAPMKGFVEDEGELLSRKLKQPSFKAAFKKAVMNIDGKLDESVWSSLKTQSGFTYAVSMRAPSQKTSLRMFHDDTNLYLGVECRETERGHLIGDGGKLWSHDALDVTFAPLPRSKHFHKFVIDFRNEIYQETRPVGVKQEKWKIKSAVVQNKGKWIWEAAIPLKYIKLKDGAIAFNLLRYRPGTSGVEALSWSLIPELNYMDPTFFGTIKLEKGK
jgi:hypothetical protein